MSQGNNSNESADIKRGSVGDSSTESSDFKLPGNPPANPLLKVVVVLSHTSHPGNIGAAARAMKTMGLNELRLVNPDTFPSEIATARAAGATDVLATAQVFASFKDALADCVYVVGSSARGRDFVGEVIAARAAATRLIEATPQGKVALVFGCENSGLSNAEVALCQTLAFIPANPDYSSLNLGAAVQVFAYELRMAAAMTRGYTAPEFQLATQAEIDALFVHMEDVFTKIGFYNPDNPRRLFARLRRLFNRTRLEREEVDIFRGIFKAVQSIAAPGRERDR